jgi:hypothetical protein
MLHPLQALLEVQVVEALLTEARQVLAEQVK